MDDNMSIDSVLGGVTLTGYATQINEDDDPQSYLDFDGYLKLMVAQMSNQDFNDPMSDSEFIQQMASYSMMETIGKMNQQSQISYAASLVGKAVTVADSDGNIDTGVVESVIIGDGKYQLLVNGSKYDSDKVTDIVDPNTYNTLSKLIGVKAIGTDDEGNEYEGVVTNVIIKDGKGYLTIGSMLFPFENISFDTNNDNSGTSGDGTGDAGASGDSGASGTSGGGTGDTGATGSGTAGTAGDGGTVTASASVGALSASAVYTAKVRGSDAAMFLSEMGLEVSDDPLYNEYMSRDTVGYYSDLDMNEDGRSDFIMTDSNNYSAYFTAVRNDNYIQNSGVNMDGYNVARVENTASAFSAKSDPGEEEGTVVRASTAKSGGNNDYDGIYGNDEDDEYTDTDITDEILSLGDIESDNAVIDNYYDDYAEYPTRGKVTPEMTSSFADRSNTEAYKENPYSDMSKLNHNVIADGRRGGFNYSDRAFAYLYPEEAALANKLNTKMFDIRFIHNTDINSTINTRQILGSSINGKYFTDVGFSGKGRLGEVVTWEDGTQRVELICQNGASVWFTTSGRYTLDQICDFSENFDLADKLTPFESAIRSASKEYSSEELMRRERDRQFYSKLAYSQANGLDFNGIY